LAQGPSIEQQFDIVFGKGGEVDLKLDFARPSKGGPFPLIICIHGGGWQKGHHHGYRWAIKWLAEKGYAAATVEYRLAPKYKFPAQVEDVKAAVRFFRAKAKEFNIDPDRIGAWGDSVGGYLATMLGLTDKKDNLEGNGGNPDYSSKVQAVVNYYGGADLRTWKLDALGDVAIRLGFNGKDLNGVIKDFVGTADRNDPITKRATAATYADPKDPPILTIHGTLDILVPIDEGRRFHEALKKAGVDSTLVEMPGANHGFKGADRAKAEKLLLEFFERHLMKR
jgi:acetyl esterase/lipase